ncbi:MAG: fabG [Bradyrhizobium sp.]|nr:fabG [Bradyrhizobium sp.]
MAICARPGRSRRTGNYVGALRNAAISAITKNLADELGPHGINAIALHPGFLRTPTADAATKARVKTASSLGRLIEFSEIAWLVTMLASPRSAAISGDTLQAAGGTRGVIDY